MQKQIDELNRRVKALEDRLNSTPSPSPSPSLPPPLVSEARDIWRLTKIIEAKKELMEKLKNQHSFEVSTGRRWTDNDAHRRFVQLRKEVESITEQIAGM